MGYTDMRMRPYNWQIITSVNKKPDEIHIYAEDEEGGPHMLVIDHFQPSFYTEQTSEVVEWVESTGLGFILINEGYKIKLIKVRCLNLQHREEVMKTFYEKFGYDKKLYYVGLVAEMMITSNHNFGYCKWVDARLAPIPDPYKEDNPVSEDPEEPEEPVENNKRGYRITKWWKVSRVSTGMTTKK